MAPPNPASKDLLDLLDNAGVGTPGASSGWGLFIGEEPAEPDQAITLYDTSGGEPNAKWLLDEPHVQCRIRGARHDYPGAHSKAQEVMDTLLGLPQQTQGGTVYVGIWALNSPFFLESDDNRRAIFTVNFRIVREPSDETGTNRSSI